MRSFVTIGDDLIKPSIITQCLIDKTVDVTTSVGESLAFVEQTTEITFASYEAMFKLYMTTKVLAVDFEAVAAGLLTVWTTARAGKGPLIIYGQGVGDFEGALVFGSVNSKKACDTHFSQVSSKN